MWYLKDKEDKIIYLVPQKTEVIIGRSPDPTICDFAIQDDPSISRKHAVLSYIDNNIYIKDLGSRYGTFVNNNKVEGANTSLKHGDVVKFGKMGSIWNVYEGKLVTCTSTLKGENLTNLKQILAKIGGVLKGDWDDTCRYLTMPAITLTIKVVLALVQGSHIVTTEFWNKCLSAITNNEALPDPNNYTPSIVETTLNKDCVSFLPNSRRAELFAGKKFFFFSKRQYDMYKPVLLKGAATPLLLNESKLTKAMLCEDDMVVIQYNITSTSQETEAQKNQIADIVNHLKSKGKRVIADAEIGLAILYVSTDKYCNPSFNFTSEVVRQNPAQQTAHRVLAPETQEQAKPPTKENVIINESLSNDTSVKRKTCDDDDINANASKRFAAESNITTNDTNSKRKYDNEGTDNPNKKMALGEQEDNDLFNFITPGSNDISNKTKSADKLNLSKPHKRKSDFDSNEDDLFNFVQNEENNTSRRMFEEEEVNSKKQKHEHPGDLASVRDSKLEELNKINQNWSANSVLKPQNIKKEPDDLDDKMNRLDIGLVIVTVNNSLIVKKEPLEALDRPSTLQNFKKFKKVWPIKVQVTVIPNSSMIVVNSNDICEGPTNDVSMNNGTAKHHDASVNDVNNDACVNNEAPQEHSQEQEGSQELSQTFTQ